MSGKQSKKNIFTSFVIVKYNNWPFSNIIAEKENIKSKTHILIRRNIAFVFWCRNGCLSISIAQHLYFVFSFHTRLNSKSLSSTEGPWLLRPQISSNNLNTRIYKKESKSPILLKRILVWFFLWTFFWI